MESCGISKDVNNFQKAFNNVLEMDNISAWNEEAEIISINQDAGIKLMNKVIFTHIPRGPYNGKYYFFKRKNNI
ncbi:MAG: hypothetical protein NTX65_03445 [Ignavibacteriales bacterium]|nr:hypothetical protein [Ignavibacteriales bacterium]